LADPEGVASLAQTGHDAGGVGAEVATAWVFEIDLIALLKEIVVAGRGWVFGPSKIDRSVITGDEARGIRLVVRGQFGLGVYRCRKGNPNKADEDRPPNLADGKGDNDGFGMI